MEAVADGLWQLRGRPRHAINVYLAGDVLVDAGTRQAGKRILRQLRGRPVHAHALTHVHPDHQGASRAVCTELDVPLWVGEDDAPAMEDEAVMHARVGTGAATFVQRKLWIGPPHRSRGGCARATSSPASSCSRRPGTRPATSPTGASRTAR
jgi:hydroxyacylglutathione hydrolase